MKITSEAVKYVSERISNSLYGGNLQATRELMELFNSVSRKELETADDYICMYEECFYTYANWGELVESEKDLVDGLTERELREELEDEKGSVWRLSCGWYVQRV